jgi:pilus assembly protein Flp/PilA
MRVWLRLLLRHEHGATMVEYGLMVAFIAAVALMAIDVLGDKLTDLFRTVSQSI